MGTRSPKTALSIGLAGRVIGFSIGIGGALKAAPMPTAASAS
jgi:hypothetical protein